MNNLKNKIHIILAFFCVLLASVSNCQTITDDLIEMNKRFNNLKAFDTSVDIKVFKKESDKIPTFHSVGRSAKSDNRFFLNVLNRKTIVNNNLMLVIDDQQKLLMYSKITKEQMEIITNPQQLNFDSIIRSQKWNAKYLINNDDEKRVQLQNSEGDIKAITMAFNAKTFVLKEITYIYSNEIKQKSGNAKVVVTYLNFALDCKHPELFDQSKYVVKKGDKYIAKEAYKKYKLINPEDFTNK